MSHAGAGHRRRGRQRITVGRVAAAFVVLLLLAAAWTAWLGYQAYQGLQRAETAVADLRSSVDADDRPAQQVAVRDLQEAGDDVIDATGGWWWGGLTHVPVVGDDFEALRLIGSGVSRIADDGAAPLLRVSGQLDDVSRGGRIDLDVVEQLGGPVDSAAAAFRAASDEASAVDARDLAGVLSTRFFDYQEQVTSLADGLEAGSTAVDLLPAMAGGEGERNYLLVFQNNAEIRATGGLPGSWARVEAVDGDLSLREQGAWTDFPTLEEPVLPLTEGEQVALQDGYGLTFQSPGYSRDFPRAAQMWDAFWDDRYPATDLDGVIAIDPVALSYLVEGTGPVQVGETTLTADTLVQQVLNEPYLRLTDPEAQDAFFQLTARSVFDTITGDLASPTDFVAGLARAGREGRFLVAPFVEDEAAALDGTPVAGQLTGPDAEVPYAGVGINDATGSKMSYYLRYDADIDATSCTGGRQEMAASLALRQNIAPADAAQLPVYVTGGGSFGTEPGSQLLSVQLYGPPGGTFGPVQLDGEVIEGLTAGRLDNGQPVVRIPVLLDSREDVRITWAMQGAEGQTGDPVLGVTPGVLPGSQDATASSAC